MYEKCQRVKLVTNDANEMFITSSVVEDLQKSNRELSQIDIANLLET